MANFISYKVKKGYYHDIEDIIIDIPASTIFIKDNTNPEDGLHDGHYHFLGICPYKEFYQLMDYIDINNFDNHIDDYYDLDKDYVLFRVRNTDDMNCFNCVTPTEFNKTCDFTKYCIAVFKNGELSIMRKIKYINSVSDIEVIDVNSHCLDRWSVNLNMLFFNNLNSHKVVIKKNNIINMYYKQMVYNALTSMAIPCNKSYNKNINIKAIEYIHSDIINFNFTDEDIILYDKLINFKTYIKYE